MDSILPNFNTLSVFPSLLALWPLAPFLLRLTAAYFIGRAGYVVAFKRPGLSVNVRIIGYLKLAAALLLFIGLYTQGAALAAIILTLLSINTKRNHPELIEQTYSFLILLIVVLLSILILGAGWWAFDLPL